MLDATGCPPRAAMSLKAGARRVFRRDLLLAAGYGIIAVRVFPSLSTTAEGPR
jgi:hypothetical protein